MRLYATAGLAAGLLFATSATSATYVVDAFLNSSSGGVGVDTLVFDVGDLFTISVDPDDLWNAGALPRWSDADGLDDEERFATGSDESGQAAGVLIGGDFFGFHTQNGLTARFGTLVGELGGVYQVLGTSFSGPAWNSGTLRLYYWDSNFADNTEDVLVSLTAVPEPTTWALMILGFGGAGVLLRRRRAAHA